MTARGFTLDDTSLCHLVCDLMKCRPFQYTLQATAAWQWVGGNCSTVFICMYPELSNRPSCQGHKFPCPFAKRSWMPSHFRQLRRSLLRLPAKSEIQNFRMVAVAARELETPCSSCLAGLAPVHLKRSRKDCSSKGWKQSTPTGRDGKKMHEARILVVRKASNVTHTYRLLDCTDLPRCKGSEYSTSAVAIKVLTLLRSIALALEWSSKSRDHQRNSRLPWKVHH